MCRPRRLALVVAAPIVPPFPLRVFMPRRSLAIVLLVATACSQAEPATPTLSTSPATTVVDAVAPSTTLAAPDLSDVAPDLAFFIETTFDGSQFAGDPQLLDALRSEVGLPYSPTRIDVGAGVVGETRIAVVVTDSVAVAGINDGSGWRWIAGSIGDIDIYPGLPGVFAIVGSDARPGENVARSRADSIHLVSMDGRGGATIIGVPRDSNVARKGGGMAKINGALSNGGIEGLMWSLEQLSGFPIDGYVLTGFEGFQEIVGSVLGAVAITLEEPMNDGASGADFPAGEVHMNGVEALAFTRNRKGLLTGDFGRQLNGGVMLIAGAIAAKNRGPVSIPSMIEGTEPWLLTDIPADRLLTLALAVHRLNPLEIRNQVLPGTPGTVNGSSVVVLSEEAAAILAAIDPSQG